MLSLHVKALCAGLMLLCLWTATETRSACPAGWTRSGQSCFLLITEPRPWLQAQEVCETMRGKLATVSSSTQNHALSRIMKSKGEIHAWIGLNDLAREGHFRWAQTNRKPTYTNWYPKEPNDFKGEDCTMLRLDQRWSDVPCSFPLSFICELTL